MLLNSKFSLEILLQLWSFVMHWWQTGKITNIHHILNMYRVTFTSLKTSSQVHARSIPQISWKCAHTFFSYHAPNKQTNKHANGGDNRTPAKMAKVISSRNNCLGVRIKPSHQTVPAALSDGLMVASSDLITARRRKLYFRRSPVGNYHKYFSGCDVASSAADRRWSDRRGQRRPTACSHRPRVTWSMTSRSPEWRHRDAPRGWFVLHTFRCMVRSETCNFIT